MVSVIACRDLLLLLVMGDSRIQLILQSYNPTRADFGEKHTKTGDYGEKHTETGNYGEKHTETQKILVDVTPRLLRNPTRTHFTLF